MFRSIEILPYENCIKLMWESDYIISVYEDGNSICIKANSAGLTSLARHLLTLAEHDVPNGCHVHLDDSNSLEDGSTELILIKSD